MNDPKDDLAGTARLRERGWSPAMIRDLLGEPDKTYPNPHSRKSGPVRLWLMSRVAEVESSPEFTGRVKQARKRSATAGAVAERKRAELIAEISAMPPPKIPILPWGALVKRVCESYNSHNAMTGRDFDAATRDSDKDFLERIAVNYLRHELSSYEADLNSVAGRIGVADARDLIRERIYDAIGDAYPDLVGECLAQQTSRL